MTLMQAITAQFGAKPQFIVSGAVHYDINQGDLGAYLYLSILLLKPQMSSGMCGRRKWAWLAGRGRCTESKPELETVNR